MPFPQSPLDVLVELGLGGTWTNITSDVLVRDGIDISRGGRDESPRVDPSTCTLTVKNQGGKFSPRNPLGPLYGQIGRNTPLRVSVNTGPAFLATTGTTSSDNGASTPDAAALDITGDIDIRFEATLANWSAAGSVELCGKGLKNTNQRSWLLMARDGNLHFEWSTDGVSTLQKDSTAPIPAFAHLAVRVTLDVNNGAGGNTLTFYTAPSMAGPWAQLGAPIVTAGTTSIFNSTAPVRVGDGWGDLGFPCSSGAVQRFELHNGIDGTIACSPDFTAQTPGAASFVDSNGLTWTVGNATSISNRRTRFVGEVSSWPARWDVSGKDVYVPLEAAGISRRLGQGAKPLASALRRRVPSYQPLAYWPMEEGTLATHADSPVEGVRPLTASGLNWAQNDTLPSSESLPVLASNNGVLPRMRGEIPSPSGSLTGWSIYWLYRLDQANTSMRTYLRFTSTGTVADWYVQTSGSSGSTIRGLDADGNVVVNQAIGTGSDLFGQWVQVNFSLTQSGGTVNWVVVWEVLGTAAGQSSGSYTGTTGRPTAVLSPPDGFSPELDGMAIGHISAWPAPTTAAYDNANLAWAGETAGSRLLRLTAEESIPLAFQGDSGATERVGPQTPITLLELLDESADADGGMRYEYLPTAALAYRSRATFYNQTPRLALDYAARGEVAPPLEPVDDDQQVRNDITVARREGSSARAVLETGALSINPPPTGVGIYDEQVTLNLFDDSQPEQHAGWRLHLGTADEARYPSVHVNLAAAPQLAQAVTDTDIGDRITIANLPAWMPPGGADLIARGYAETIGVYDWDVTYNCTPASPWTVSGIAPDPAAQPWQTAYTQTFTGGAGGWRLVSSGAGADLGPAPVQLDGGDMAAYASTSVIYEDTTTLPYDPMATYRITATFRTKTAPTSPALARAYAGFTGVRADGTRCNFTGANSVSSQSYAVLRGTVPPATYTTYTGYVHGVVNPGDAGANNDPASPMRMHPDVVAVRPLAYLLNGCTDGEQYLTQFTIEKAKGAPDQVDTDGSIIGANATSTATQLLVHTVPQGNGPLIPWASTAGLAPTGPAAFPIELRTGGEVVRAWDIQPAGWDTFDRTVANGWGTAANGVAWAIPGGAASERSVNGAQGVVTIPGASISTVRFQTLATGIADCEVRVRLSPGQVSTGASIVPAILLRYVDTSNYYRARLHFATGGELYLSITRDTTQLGGTPQLPLSYASGDQFEMRVRLTGHRIQMRVWPTGALEPSIWHNDVTVTASTIATGAVGVTASGFTGNTNTNPAMGFDQFEIVSPQTVTAVRSVNGIAKAQTAGTDVRLATPPITAL
ncbi:hypothetical protein [Streptomyces sp. NPDC055140]